VKDFFLFSAVEHVDQILLKFLCSPWNKLQQYKATYSMQPTPHTKVSILRL